jgi:hypothetical protein
MRSQVTDAGDGHQIPRVAANIRLYTIVLNRQSQTTPQIKRPWNDIHSRSGQEISTRKVRSPSVGQVKEKGNRLDWNGGLL